MAVGLTVSGDVFYAFFFSSEMSWMRSGIELRQFLRIFLPTLVPAVLVIGGGVWVVRWSWVNFQCRGVLLVWIRVGQGPTALAVGADGDCLDIFTLIYPLSFSLSLGDDPI